MSESFQKTIKGSQQSNADLAAQERAKRMTRDERHRGTIDWMTKKILDKARMEGKEMTDSSARKQATDLAHTVIRKDPNA